MTQHQPQSPVLSLVDNTELRRKHLNELQAWSDEGNDLNQLVEMALELVNELDGDCITSTQEITRIKLLLDCFISRNILVHDEMRATVTGLERIL